MTTTMAALSSPSIIQAEFIRLVTSTQAGSFLIGTIYTITTVGSTNFTLIGASANTVGVVFTCTGAGAGTGTATNTYYFCNAAAPITVSGMTFNNLGSLLSISAIDRNIKANSADLAISLTGVDGTNVALVLAANIKGSEIFVYRGFLDSNNQIIMTPSQQWFTRYTGIVSNCSITEDFNDQLRTRIATVGITCASFRTILENRIQGIKTTPKAWNFIYPSDTSMNRVPVIAATYFDFGKPPQSATVSSNTSNVQTTFLEGGGGSG